MATVTSLQNLAGNPMAAVVTGNRAVGAVLLATVGDPDSTRTVTAIIALLVVLGVVMVMVTVWLYRSTRPDPELLAPLEAMGQRRWRRSDPVWQRRRLDALRPEGAVPLAPSVAPPEIDAAFDAGPAVSGFDDLHDDAPDHVGADPGSSGSIENAAGDTPPAGLTPPPADASRADIGTPAGLERPPIPPDHVDAPERGTNGDADADADRAVTPEVLALAMSELDDEMTALAARRAARTDRPGQSPSAGGEREASTTTDVTRASSPSALDGVDAGRDPDGDS